MAKKWSQVFPKATTNDVAYLLDGPAAFSSFVQAIESANSSEHYIYILGWMLDVDFPLTGTLNENYRNKKKKNQHYYNGNKTLFNLLEAASKKGVEIRILIWNNPLYTESIDIAYEKLSQLANTRVFTDDFTFTPDQAVKLIGEIEAPVKDLFRRLAPVFISNSRLVEGVLNAKPEEILYRSMYYLDSKNVGSHHEKILIVNGEDGLVSFCGGIDVNPNRITGQHDISCRVVGPEAHRILERFTKRWDNHKYAKGVSLLGSANIKPQPVGPVTSQLYSAHLVHNFNSYDGKTKVRSFRDAYFKILENARSYIYIEDQYLVNLEVAQALNKKLKESLFKQLIIVIQESVHTTDLLIPARKRAEFYDEVIKGTDKDQKSKLVFVMINDKSARESNRHNVMHSKLLIVDDEVAVIGSGNVNQRSFTLDSETSLIVFNEMSDPYRDNFAYKLRQAIWNDLIYNKPTSGDFSWEEFSRTVFKDERYSVLSAYSSNQEDLDVRIIDTMRPQSVVTTIIINEIFDDDLPKAVYATSVASNPVAITSLIDSIFECIVDPKVD